MLNKFFLFLSQKKKRLWIFLLTICLTILVTLGLGMTIVLIIRSRSNSSLTQGVYWRPMAGTRWQIILNSALNDQTYNAPIYDIDLFLNSPQTIVNLHAANRKVICYFSAGSYEPSRPDTNRFHDSDKGLQLDGWPDEYWLNTNSHNVRKIMTDRLNYAAKIDCDGVDPDNIDAYDNENGLGLTSTDSINFLKFLAAEAHSRNLSIGLKNGGALVSEVLGIMEWEVNEQCLQFGECDKFRPFIEAGKPVFHIEYADNLSAISSASNIFCGNEKARGFSTVLKHMLLDDWALNC